MPHEEQPRCSNCGLLMGKTRTLEKTQEGDEANVFACKHCGLTYLTEDNLPVSGQA